MHSECDDAFRNTGDDMFSFLNIELLAFLIFRTIAAVPCIVLIVIVLLLLVTVTGAAFPSTLKIRA
jgi:hypothetical protein